MPADQASTTKKSTKLATSQPAAKRAREHRSDEGANILPNAENFVSLVRKVAGIEFPGLDEPWWRQNPVDAIVFRTDCPGCGRRCQLTASNLGRKMRCPKCGFSFPVPWAEPSVALE